MNRTRLAFGFEVASARRRAILPLLTIVTAMSLFASLFSSKAGSAGSATPAVTAINSLGLDLLAKATDANANALLSPYSIQSALAMTFAGADGQTHAEMVRVLHYGGDEAELHGDFVALRQALDDAQKRSEERAKQTRQWGGPTDPLTLAIANRLFGQQGYAFREPFLALVKDKYGAPFQAMDFLHNAASATREINAWVEEQTRRRIQNLIPADALGPDTRLVLVNAIYLKAPWTEPFTEGATLPRPFHVKGGAGVDVPTMTRQGHFGYAHRDGFSVLTIPYAGGELQFLILLPDDVNGLAALEAKVSPELLATSAAANAADVILHLPKFKLEPPLFKLGAALRSLGMKTAFDIPPGSANFDRMAPRRGNDYLYISEVFHKTFLSLDEKGTEAAAATAVVMMRAAAMQKPVQPVEVRVDHPFLFAIQHRPTGACLFLGRMVDPR
jgi:serpin B